MLPPLQAALDFKTKQSHFGNKVWGNGHKSVQFITDPENFGWKLKDNVYETVWADLGPVLDIDAELRFCSGQINCRSMRCKCENNDLTHIEIYSCMNCENVTENLDLFKTCV